MVKDSIQLANNKTRADEAQFAALFFPSVQSIED